jgi:F0F1-type ATP synthase assembly protein I
MRFNAERTDSSPFWSLSIVGAMLMLDLTGYFLDLRLGTAPWFVLAGYALGLCVVLCAMIAAHRRRCEWISPPPS